MIVMTMTAVLVSCRSSEGTAEQQDIGNVQTEESKVNDTARYNMEQYKTVLDKYYSALKEQWGTEKLFSAGLCVLTTYCYEGNPLDNVGFAFLDINGDDSNELLIGTMLEDDFLDKVVFEMYTLEDGAAVRIFSSEERDRYYVYSEEAGGYLIANEGSGGAGSNSWYYYDLDGKELAVCQAILQESDADSTAWYMAYDADWDTGNDNPIEEELGTAVIESIEARYICPEYTAFSRYQP